MGTFVHCDSNGGNVDVITGVTWGTAGAATASGDIAIIPWVFLNTVTPVNPTSETWTEVLDNTAGATDCRGKILVRTCDGTESGDITGWTNGGTANRQAAVLCVLRGYDFISGFSVRDETTNTTAHDCPTLTTADGYNGNSPADGDTILVFVFERAASTTATSPSGWTVRTGGTFAATGTGGTIVSMADDTLTDSATFPVDPASYTLTASSDDAFTVTMSLRPSSSGTALNFGQSTETDTALGLTTSKAATYSQAAETDTALNLATSKTAASGLATETDTALGLTAGKTATYGQATETDSGLAATFGKTIAFGLATETDAAAAASFTAAGSTQFGLAMETDTALAMTWSKAATFGRATETDSALGWAPAKVKQLGQAAESESALAASLMKTIPYGLAAEVDAAFALTASKSIGLGQAAETDTAAAVSFTGPYSPLIDPVATARANPATATPRANDAAASTRPNQAEVS